MNIKEHIEAGHYPTDAKGRALVQCGRVTVVATDRPGPLPIVGWNDDGHIFVSNGENIDPPPPRKGVARAWVVYPKAEDGLPSWGMPAAVFDNPHEPMRRYAEETWDIVEMLHAYEVPW